jgi:hypothetical protein
MKRLGFSSHSEERRNGPAPSNNIRTCEPNLEGPRISDVVFEIAIVLALHLAFACAVIMTLRAYGIA